MEWQSETWLILRDTYYSWQCGRVGASGVHSMLEEANVRIGASFIELLGQHDQARDIKFSEFIRALKRPEEPAPSSSVLASEQDVTPTHLHIKTFRDIPVPSSVKAPFGTDHNVYVRGFTLRGDENPACVSALRETVFDSRSSRAAVQGSSNAFKESSASSDDGDSMSQHRLEIPRHLMPSINPITGEEPFHASVHSYPAPFIRRQMDNDSHLQPIETGIAPININDFPEGQRRHFSFFNQESTPVETVSTESSSPRFDISDNILCHNTDRELERYRPMSRITRSKNKAACPFATDGDDLESLRLHLHSTPLGKPYVPPVYATQ